MVELGLVCYCLVIDEGYGNSDASVNGQSTTFTEAATNDKNAQDSKKQVRIHSFLLKIKY